MTFPSVRSDVAGVQGTNSSSWTGLTYPSTISAGDLILVAIARDGASGAATISGFASQIQQAAASNAARLDIFAKVAVGTESGTFTYSPGASEQGAWRVASYQDWWGTIATGLEIGGIATGTSTTPNPGSFSPAWGAADTRWRAQAAQDRGLQTVTGFPTDYTINQNDDQSGGGSGACIMGASRDINTATQDPSNFTVNSSQAWAAVVIAIRPAAAGAAASLILPRRRIPHLIGR